MSIRALDHVQLAIPAGGEPIARGFFTGLLGMVEVPKPPAQAARGGCWFEAGTVKLHLGVDPSFTPATKAHPALVVDDLAALRAQLAEAGHPVVADEPVDGRPRGFVADPFGNRIELIQG